MSALQFKTGSTFSYTFLVDIPTPTGAWVAKAQVRAPGNVLVQDLTATTLLPVAPSTNYGVLLESTAALAALWPVQLLHCDVSFTDSAVPPVTVYSPSFYINVVNHVTAP